jgi:argininosuccinate lyase
MPISSSDSLNGKPLWGGRFGQPPAELARSFSHSIKVDGRLFREDIAGSIAHVEMLAATGVIPNDEASTIADALRQIELEIESGAFLLDGDLEDIHMAIEGRLIEKVGAIGGKLHTGRSRNDQIALDERLHFRMRCEVLCTEIMQMQRALVDTAGANIDVIMPGYTHMQRAQPVLLAHHLLAYVEMLERDKERFADCMRRMNRSPLGAAALAGTSYPLDRRMVADALGFDGITTNSIDTVSDRDYLIEFVAACSITMMHLSRLAEEFVLWSTREFGFITISDAYATGSSIMPQKKNPDMAELVRGKTGRVYGALINLLTMMKGLPLAYNRDMQEDKEPAFEAADTLSASLRIFTDMIATCTFNSGKMRAAASTEFITATELADYLVRKGLPFREAHEITGRAVAHCVEHGCELHELSLETLRAFSSIICDDIFAVLDPATSIELKRSAGSTAPVEVRGQLERWRVVLGIW